MTAVLEHVTIRGFRTAHDVAFSPGPLCALVGEANTGKSNLLLAVRALLDPGAPPFGADELAPGAERIEIDGTLTDSRHITLGERRSGPSRSSSRAPSARASSSRPARGGRRSRTLPSSTSTALSAARRPRAWP